MTNIYLMNRSFFFNSKLLNTVGIHKFGKVDTLNVNFKGEKFLCLNSLLILYVL